MNSLYLLIPLSLFFVAAAAAVFIVALRRGQFDRLKDYEGRMPDDFR